MRASRHFNAPAAELDDPLETSTSLALATPRRAFSLRSEIGRRMVLDESSVCRTRVHNLFDGPRVRYQSTRVYERGPHVECTTGPTTASGT
jgi:hypothetical protein